MVSEFEKWNIETAIPASYALQSEQPGGFAAIIIEERRRAWHAATLAEGEANSRLYREVGNVLDHWDGTPNDIKTDPGIDSLARALRLLRAAAIRDSD